MAAGARRLLSVATNKTRSASVSCLGGKLPWNDAEPQHFPAFGVIKTPSLNLIRSNIWKACKNCSSIMPSRHRLLVRPSSEPRTGIVDSELTIFRLQQEQRGVTSTNDGVCRVASSSRMFECAWPAINSNENEYSEHCNSSLQRSAYLVAAIVLY